MHSGQGGGPYIGGAGSGWVGVGTGAGSTGVVGSGGSGSGWGNGVGSVIRTSVESCTATSMRTGSESSHELGSRDRSSSDPEGGRGGDAQAVHPKWSSGPCPRVARSSFSRRPSQTTST